MLIASASLAAEEEFPWEMFLPAITGAGHSQQLTCENISNCYNGLFYDTCSGSNTEGRINVKINNDCTFSAITNSNISATGKFANKNGSTYIGSGKTDYNGCGSFNISITDNESSISAVYNYSNGKKGNIPGAISGTCKSANRLNSEMLAGNWRFNYKIGDTSYTDYYVFDINSVQLAAGYSDVYTIYGKDEYGDIVFGGYSPDISNHELIDPSIIDGWFDYFQFSFTGNGYVSGCYYLITNGYFYSCKYTTGTRLSY